MQPITLFIVEQVERVREGIHMVLATESAITVVGSASRGEEVLQVAPALKPQVMLLGLDLPDMPGVALAEALKPQLPSTRLIALTNHDNAKDLVSFFTAGGSGYVLKVARPNTLIEALRVVSRGGMWAPEKFLDDLANVRTTP